MFLHDGKRAAAASVAAAVLALSACSSNFSGGTQTAGAPVPPVTNAGVNNPTNVQNALRPSPASSDSGATSASLPFADAASGLQCPTANGYTCVLSFNMPEATATPSAQPKGNHHAAKTPKASPSATPTDTPTATPSAAPSASASGSSKPSTAPSPDASAGAAASASPATVTLAIEAPPKDPFTLKSSDDKAPPTTALAAVRMKVSADVTIAGRAQADFTLPDGQIVKDRGFAIGLYHETIGKHNKRNDQFFGSYSTFTTDGNVLHFTFSSPPISVKSNETWIFVLFGDTLHAASASSGASASDNPSTEPASTASASPTP
jgi:hypothetical protein